jgi:hypothetical protein
MAPLCGVTHADVIVLANRTGRDLTLSFTPLRGQPQQLSLPINDVTPQFLDGKAEVSFSSKGVAKKYLLDANCAYYFGRGAAGQIDMQKIGLGEDGTATGDRSPSGSASRRQLATVAVKILVDEDEPGRQVTWERRLRRRIEAASAIFEKFCGVKLQVVAVETWNSDNKITEFESSLAEFEREVKPSPARVSIGFTGQWTMVRGRIHMAGTRGPLHSHILVREGSPEISEPERLEFLVHELGHFMGATHSPEQTSVMRPVLGDNQAGRKGFRIQFDPVNALIVAMIGESMRRGSVKTIADLPADTRRRLQQVYIELARALPNDPSGQRYVQLMGLAQLTARSPSQFKLPPPPKLSPQTTPLVKSARQIMKAIVTAAGANRALPNAGDQKPSGNSRRAGDVLTDHLVRKAAQAATASPPDVAPKALLLALGIGLDNTDQLSRLPIVGSLAQGIETPAERSARVAILGEPTMRGRHDLMQHFVLSAYLTAAVGADAAETIGMAKEISDSHGASGFSFADLAADRAGTRFAERVLDKQLSLRMLAQTFSTETFLPKLDSLREGLSAADFKTAYGSEDDPRVRKVLEDIDQRILRLPPYRQKTTPIGN